jgi:hypothetical protein
MDDTGSHQPPVDPKQVAEAGPPTPSPTPRGKGHQPPRQVPQPPLPPAGARRLAKVVSISDSYPNRGQGCLVRVYLEVRLGDQRKADQDGAAERRSQATIHWAGRQLPPP